MIMSRYTLWNRLNTHMGLAFWLIGIWKCKKCFKTQITVQVKNVVLKTFSITSENSVRRVWIA